MRLPLAEFTRGKGEGNRRALRALVARRPPGLIAYADEEPAGWIAVAPREQYARLGNSRVLAPVAGEGVWSAPCFFVKAGFRRTGLSGALLEAACEFARRNGARSLEGYPTANRTALQPAAFVWTGMESTFIRAGFREVARRSPTRPIMRREFVRGPGRAAPPAMAVRVGTPGARRPPANTPARPAAAAPAARRSNWNRAAKPARKAVRRG